MLLCAAKTVPTEFSLDRKQAVLPVNGPSHHARLIYPYVRALLMRYDVAGTKTAHSTIRTATHQSGIGDYTLAHLLAGVDDADTLHQAELCDVGHLQGLLPQQAAPPQAALRCPRTARMYLEDDLHIVLPADPTLEWAADRAGPLPWPTARASPATAEPAAGTSAHAEGPPQPARGSAGTSAAAAHAGVPGVQAEAVGPARARLDSEDASSGGDAVRTLIHLIEDLPGPYNVQLDSPVLLFTGSCVAIGS